MPPESEARAAALAVDETEPLLLPWRKQLPAIREQLLCRLEEIDSEIHHLKRQAKAITVILEETPE